VLVGGQSLVAIDAKIPAMVALGYEYMPEHEVVLPRRRFFAVPLTRRGFFMYTRSRWTVLSCRASLFRDALRTDSRQAEECFRALSVELAARFGNDREGYADAKRSFIRS
jgi:GrpB-like predicted nucleotidyltransferase (UPF0157 family)